MAFVSTCTTPSAHDTDSSGSGSSAFADVTSRYVDVTLSHVAVDASASASVVVVVDRSAVVLGVSAALAAPSPPPPPPHAAATSARTASSAGRASRLLMVPPLLRCSTRRVVREAPSGALGPTWEVPGSRGAVPRRQRGGWRYVKRAQRRLPACQVVPGSSATETVASTSSIGSPSRRTPPCSIR